MPAIELAATGRRELLTLVFGGGGESAPEKTPEQLQADSIQAFLKRRVGR